MDLNGSDPEQESVEIGGWDGFRSMIAALYTVGGIRLVLSTLTRFGWTSFKGWFRRE